MNRRAFLVSTIPVAMSLYAGDPMKKPYVYIGGYDSKVTCFEMDPATGSLKSLSVSDCGKSPSYLAWHPGRKFMYAVNEGNPGKMLAFSINSKDGALTKINDGTSSGNGPCHLSVSPGGKWVYSANYGSGTIGVLPIKTDGSVGDAVYSHKSGEKAHQIISDSTGKYVFVPCNGSDYIAQYVLDDATGKLAPNDPPTAAVDKGAGPRHMAFHPNNRWAYVINEQGMSITRMNYEAAKGTLAAVETVSTLPPGVSDKSFSTAHIVVSPDGKFVYGSNRTHDSLVIFAVGGDGKLTFVAHENCGGEIKVPRDFTVDPSGNFLIAANQRTNTVIVFRIDAAKGTLTKLSTTEVPKGPAFVGVMFPAE